MGEKTELKAGALQELRDELAAEYDGWSDGHPARFSLGFLRRVAAHQCHPVVQPTPQDQGSLPDGWRPGREAVARIIEPYAWSFHDRHIANPMMGAECREETSGSLRRADAILALPSAQAEEG